MRNRDPHGENVENILAIWFPLDTGFQYEYVSAGECVGVWYKVMFDTCYKLENISIMQRAGINHLAKDIETRFDDTSTQKVRIFI